LICCSNTAARRDVEERTWSRGLGESFRKSIARNEWETVEYLELVVVEAVMSGGEGEEGV
jgi:hypothetical protein